MRVAFIDYGATITAIEVRDRAGKLRNVALSLPTLAAYEATRRKYGAVIGRYAGRIGHARFDLDGRTVTLPANARGLAVHGEPNGFEKRVWRRRDFADRASIGAVYCLSSPDGDQGFPGKLDVCVTYRLLRDVDEFSIEYTATTDAPTVVNLTNHGFFNLAGAGTRGLATHTFQIVADKVVLTDALKVPTGELADVAGTPFDFRKPVHLPNIGDFDHGLVFARGAAPAATIFDASSGIRMQVFTSEPSVIFYTANGFDGSETGSEGRPYQRFDGFAFETQHLADSPNHPNFPSTELRPGQTFRSRTALRFSISGRR